MTAAPRSEDAAAGRLVLARAQRDLLREPAERFAEAVIAGARSLVVRGSVPLRFAGADVEQISRELRGALEEAFDHTAQERIERASGRPFAAFLDRIQMAWMRAEPGMTELLVSDRRGHGAFLLDVARAELFDLGLDLVIEPRPRGTRVPAPRSLRRLILPLVLYVLLWAALGGVLGVVGPGHGTPLVLIGAVAIVLVVFHFARRQPSHATCSECGMPVVPRDPVCARCGTRFAGAGDDGEEEETEEEAGSGAGPGGLPGDARK